MSTEIWAFLFMMCGSDLYKCVVVRRENEKAHILCPDRMIVLIVVSNNLKLGKWYLIDKDNQTANDCEAVYPTRIVDGFVEIRTPVVFFSDEILGDVIGFSPGFGRVGSFIPNNFINDKFYDVWIRYYDMCGDRSLQTLLHLFKVRWLVPLIHHSPLSPSDLRISAYRQIPEFTIGVVVTRTANSGQLYKDGDLAKFKVGDDLTDFQLGQFVYCIPMRDFSGGWTAVNAYAANQPPLEVVLNNLDRTQFVVHNWSPKGPMSISVPELSSSIPTVFKCLNAIAGRRLIVEYDSTINQMKAITALAPNESVSSRVAASSANLLVVERPPQVELPAVNALPTPAATAKPINESSSAVAKISAGGDTIHARSDLTVNPIAEQLPTVAVYTSDVIRPPPKLTMEPIATSFAVVIPEKDRRRCRTLSPTKRSLTGWNKAFYTCKAIPKTPRLRQTTSSGDWIFIRAAKRLFSFTCAVLKFPYNLSYYFLMPLCMLVFIRLMLKKCRGFVDL